jgi:hypothetical protein
MNRITQFFWLCSGSSRSLLSQCPTEGSKYAGIGATIFFTGVFAALASAYAFFTFTNNYWVSAGLGLVWGFLIFNLDRYIVSSMRKTGSLTTEIKMALPRIILAILISVVIARPLELKIFEKEIQTELVDMNDEIQSARINAIEQKHNTEIQNIQVGIEQLKADILRKELERNNLRALASAEADGTGGSMKRNPGPIYKIKKAHADKVEEELFNLTMANNALIEQKNKRVNNLEQSKEKKIIALSNPDYTGFAARLEALGRLTAKSSAIWLANWFIILLFIAIETAPIFVKLISVRGPYDYLLASEEQDFSLSWLSKKVRLSSTLRKKAESLSGEEKDFLNQQLSAKMS